MDDETPYFTFDAESDTETDVPEETPSLPLAVQVMAGIGSLVVAAIAGYMLGWAIGTVIDRFTTG